MRATLTTEEASLLDNAVARLGVSADEIAAAAVLSFLEGRDTPSLHSHPTTHCSPLPRAPFILAGRITPRSKQPR